MNEPEVDEKFEGEVLRECIKFLFDHLSFALLSNFAISSGMVVMLWSGGQGQSLVYWLIAVAVLAWGRWVLGAKFRQVSETDFDALLWGRRYTLSLLLSGGLLGFAGVWFFPESFLSLGELALVLVIMSIGSIMLHAAYRQAHVVYVLLTLLPFTLRCFLTQEMFDAVVGVVVLLFIPINLYLAKKMGVTVIKSIHLQLRNQALIKELTAQTEIAQSAQIQAEQANRDKTRFMATASHDLRQPVQALEFFSAALNLELQAHPSRALAENIRATGRELGELLDALLDFSQADLSVVHPVKRDHPVADLLQRLRAEFSLQANEKGLRYQVVSSSAWVHSDPVLLERMVRNLLTNAFKYTRTGKVLLGCRRVAAGLRIEVHDTGVGIPLDQQQLIFGEFIQLENPERDRRKGLGLGLAIVDNLARAMSLTLTLRSTPNKGSVFGVTVPLGVPQAATTTADLEPAVDQSDNALILLVDDDVQIRESVARLLENWGYAVITADSAAEALEVLKARARVPNVVLADQRLREGKTGLQAIHDIRAYCGHTVPAALLTGDTEPAHAAQAKALGIPLLRKPLPAAKLRSLIGNLLRA
jgi:signal transduction histidine kinase